MELILFYEKKLVPICGIYLFFTGKRIVPVEFTYKKGIIGGIYNCPVHI